MELLFDLVLDIESYPEFLPWCSAARVFNQQDEALTADLMIRFKSFQEKYTSSVCFKRPSDDSDHCFIDVSLLKGPFSDLKNHWKFKRLDDNRTHIEFYVEFKFRNTILDKLMGVVFGMAQKKLMGAFMKRAEAISN